MANNFDEHGNGPNDLIDGIAVTSVMMLVIVGIVYYLYSM
jgi:hypothetical protein